MNVEDIVTNIKRGAREHRDIRKGITQRLAGFTCKIIHTRSETGSVYYKPRTKDITNLVRRILQASYV